MPPASLNETLLMLCLGGVGQNRLLGVVLCAFTGLACNVINNCRVILKVCVPYLT